MPTMYISHYPDSYRDGSYTNRYQLLKKILPVTKFWLNILTNQLKSKLKCWKIQK